MSDDDLIRRGDVLREIANEGLHILDAAIAALPARGVGVDVEEVARAIYDAMRFERKDKTPEWVKGGNSNAQVEARSTAARILAALAPTDAAHVNETPKTKHDADNVLTDAAQAGAPFFFDRYINGVRMAEDVCIERETTLEGAMRVAARIAAKGPNGEPPVLVYRTTDAAEAERDALRAERDALRDMLERAQHVVPDLYTK